MITGLEATELYNQALACIKRGEYELAARATEDMMPSDAALIRKKIEAARAKRGAND